jgi:hypothetical protein
MYSISNDLVRSLSALMIYGRDADVIDLEANRCTGFKDKEMNPARTGNASEEEYLIHKIRPRCNLLCNTASRTTKM